MHITIHIKYTHTYGFDVAWVTAAVWLEGTQICECICDYYWINYYWRLIIIGVLCVHDWIIFVCL